MSLPVSQYEALLAEVRGLREKAQYVQQLATPLLVSNNETPHLTMETQINDEVVATTTEYRTRDDSLNLDIESIDAGSNEDESNGLLRTNISVSSEPISNPNKTVNNLYHGTWPVERTMWNSDPINNVPISHQANFMDATSVMSFASSSGGAPMNYALNCSSTSKSSQLEAKVDMVYSLLAMLGGQEHADMSETLLALSSSPDSCLAMRQSGCIPLLVQFTQTDKDTETCKKALQALHNLVNAQPDEKCRKRESRVLKLLDQLREYTESLKNKSNSSLASAVENPEDEDKHPVQSIAHLMKLSFDEAHRQAICQFGGIYTIASLIENEHIIHNSNHEETNCILLRRYACMALTNLTFGDSGNKALLCSFKNFINILVLQLQNPNDDLKQVTASVLRNLSWRADPLSKEVLRDCGAVSGLMKAAMEVTKENTLKSILSALWNLSAHCTENKSEICAVEGALGFLVDMLSYKTPSKSLAIIENSGGILRNISSQIAVRQDYREILRKHNCLDILLDQLKSPSLTIVSNACGTLWNLSAKCSIDQEALWQMGAPAMLRSLNNSKHKMIAMGSSAALKNLLSSRPTHSITQLDNTARAMDLPVLPTLGMRKQKALLQDLDQNLSETFENIDKDSPTKIKPEESALFKVPKKSTTSKNVYAKDSKYNYLSESHCSKTEVDQEQDICHGFKSLNINEPTMNFHKTSRNNMTSLTYESLPSYQLNKKSRSTSLPLENTKFLPKDKLREKDSSKSNYNDSKYFLNVDNKKGKSSINNLKKSNKNEYSYSGLVEHKDDSYYAETDLDQPTDYSLRYAENDSDSDVCDKLPSDIQTGFIQDTVKTYCTEGTPYETPFFSNATSMSDLRLDSQLTTEKNVIDNDQIACNVPVNLGRSYQEHVDENEKEHCSSDDISDKEHLKNNSQNFKSQLSSGLLSPEKPINYCEEGTPGYFSRVSSFGSLEEAKEEKDICEINKSQKITKNLPVKGMSSNEDAKTKVEGNINYAEETPLMFSRSSSLASLDSIEQHSIHDDRSSVISDFSRLTSGIISPSELPDSPTQTIPPSPRHNKKFNVGKVNKISDVPYKPSVFEDNITKFKEESTPIQFSTATSLSSLTIDDHEDNCKVSSQKSVKNSEGLQKNSNKENEKSEKDIYEELDHISENENDDDILANCINIGMQNHRRFSEKDKAGNLNKNQREPAKSKNGAISKINSNIPVKMFERKILRSDINSDTTITYHTEDTPAALSNAVSNSDLSILSIQNESEIQKDYLSDESSNLSIENENILAECIQSAMPSHKNSAKKVSVFKERDDKNTSNSSLKSSDVKNEELFLPTKKMESKNLPPYMLPRDEVSNYAVENSPCLYSLKSSLSDLTVEDEHDKSKLQSKKESTRRSSNEQSLKPESKNESDEQLNLSRNNSLSSLSVESVGSLETEEALLEQCISSGMPKSKHNVTPNKSYENENSTGNKKHSVIEKNLNENLSNHSKNLTVTSASNNSMLTESTNLEKKREADGKSIRELESKAETAERSTFKQIGSKNLSSKLDIDLDINETECALSQIVDDRLLDPEAMIESLDRFTAELVSHSSHLHTSEEKNQRSINEGDTWNEDSSNDVTFPSISGSVPNVISFSSEKILVETKTEEKSNDFSSINTSTLTDSTIIAIEATKIANTFESEANSNSITSIGSLELDKIAPPSQMNSLMGSSVDLESFQEISKTSPKPTRKKSLPANSLIKKALTNSLQQATSVESLEGNSSYNLDNVNPPSVMNDVFDLTDLENSTTSISNLPNDMHCEEVSKEYKPNSVFDLKRLNYATSQPDNLLDLENTNPPSLFNEITDMCNSLADVATDTICSQTEAFEDCNTHIDDVQLSDDDTTEFSDAISETPVPSEADKSGPTSKKEQKIQRALTPKQRRNLAKDRYKTYTIAAEMVIKSSENSESITNSYDKESTLNDYKTVDDFPEISLDDEISENLMFQTVNETASALDSKNLSGKANLLKRRQNKNRFKTQTLSEPSVLSNITQNENENSFELKCEISEELNLLAKEENTVQDTFLTYRTYHKSWGMNGKTIPIISSTSNENLEIVVGGCDNQNIQKTPGKPKILKPTDVKSEINETEIENPVKSVRGKRKPLYSKTSTNISRPVKSTNIASNLVKNVSLSLQSTAFKSNTPKATNSKAPPKKSNLLPPKAAVSPKKNKTNENPDVSVVKNTKHKESTVERQNTFVKEDRLVKSKIPAPTSGLPKPGTSRARSAIPSYKAETKSNTSTQSACTSPKRNVKSSNSPLRLYNRSSSVESKEFSKRIGLKTSLSSLSLKDVKNQTSSSKPVNNPQKSNSATSITNSKQVVSKIASLWKKIEESKKQTPKADTRVWIKSKANTSEDCEDDKEF